MSNACHICKSNACHICNLITIRYLSRSGIMIYKTLSFFLYLVEQNRTCTSPLLSQQLSQISREMVDLLKQSPQCRMPFSKFIPSYHHFFGRQCRVADYGYNRLKDLFEAIPHVVQVRGGFESSLKKSCNLIFWQIRPLKLNVKEV